MLLDLCKLWISQLVTIYTLNTQHNLNTLSSSWHFCIYFWRAQAFFLYLDCPVVEEIWRFWFSRHHTIEVSHDFLGGASSSAPYQVLGAMGLLNVEINRFRFVTWPRDQYVTWLCEWDSLILSHHPAKFGVRRLCESGNITFFYF